MSRKLSLLMILVLLTGLFLLPAAAGAQGITDAATPPAPRYSHRLIVELSSPPLAQYSGIAEVSGQGGGKLDVASPQAQQYIQKLQAEQQAFISVMQAAIPNAQVATYLNENGQTLPATYQVVFNGMSVDAGRDVDVAVLQRKLSALPGVKHVYKDFAHDPDLYASLPLINAQAAWDNPAVGGRSHAGAGVKFASMDGGVHHLSPMFDGTGYTYPPGFPKGDTRNTNGKIIASRVYFRTWDPPSAGDENPWPGVKGTQHGSHTASTAAGEIVQASYLGAPPVTISGVAPAAYVMSYRVFYNSITNDGSFYNTEGIKALEDIVKDGADVLNNSWGGGPVSIGGEFDALDQALINAVHAGIFVSMSNGNAGPDKGTGDHSSPDYISVAASTTSGTYAAGRVKVTAPEPVPTDLQYMGYGTAQFGAPLPVGQVLGPWSFVPSVTVDSANAEGCNAFPAGAFTGKAAVIIRGTCNFSLKVLNAQNAGAVFAVIYNQASAGDSLVQMAPGTGAGDVTISSVLVGNTNGKKLVDWYNTNGAASQLALDTVAFQAGNTPDIIASFSSRGPGVGNVLKPDIAAPGVNILAQGFDPLVTGEAGNFGYGQASGTSMSAPHVSGAAILLKQIHPDWSPAWIKSALMSTSKYMDIYTDYAKTIPAQPLDMGAGRLDLTNAADPGVILDPPSLSFGAVTMGDTKTIEVAVTSVAGAAETYDVSTLYTGLGYTSLTTVAGMTVDPTSLTLAPGETKTVKVTWNTTTSLGQGDNQGYVLLKGTTHQAHMPAWMRVAYAPMPTVLEANLPIPAGVDLTLAAVGLAPALEPLVLVDNNTPPADGMARIHFVHASPDAPAVDVAISGGAVIIPNVAYKGDVQVEVPIGTYDFEVREAGTSTVDLFMPDIGLDASKIYTIFLEGTLTGPDGNKLQAAKAVVDPSAPPAGKSRIRVAHASPNATPGTIFLNDKIAFFGVAFGQITDYKTVDAGVVNIKVKPSLGDVLIIENDGASSLGLPSYLSYYTGALDALGVTYDVWDADQYAGSSVTIPSANWLAQYKAIVYETGDNYYPNGTFTVPTPPTTADMDRLVEYANNGGHVIAFGQDLASATGSTTPANAPVFYSSLLGATYLQDSVNAEEVFTDSAQLITGLPGTPFNNTSFDISAMGDGAGNQAYVDEIKIGCNDPDMLQSCAQYSTLLKYSIGGNFKEQGTVALANRDQPTLERPGRSFLGNAMYFSFGLEGVNDNTGYNSRANLLGTALNWAWDEASASIAATPNPTGRVSYFTASVDSTYGGAGVTYRWDFGDGTPFTNPYKSATAGHTYTQDGKYTVRVEVTNGLGTRTIGETEITVGSEFNTPVTETFPATADTYIHNGLRTTNFGTSTFLYVGGNDVSRSLIQFDLSSIVQNYPVDKAELSVYVDAFSGGGSVADLQAFEVTTAWDETTATWKVPWTTDGGDFVATPMGTVSIVKTDVGTWKKIDITPLVQKWVADPAGNHGVMLRLLNQTSFTVYRLTSRQYWYPQFGPMLEVSYRKP